MEIIRKKICLEPFKSRIPSIIDTVTINGVDKNAADGAWGEVPKPITIFGVEFKYGTLMNVYHSALKVVMNAKVKEYDKKGNKWIDLDYDWRDILTDESRPVSFVIDLPTFNVLDKQLVSLVSAEEEYAYNGGVSLYFDEYIKGCEFINEVHKLIGKEVTPSKFTGIYVPYFIYLTDVADQITFMEDLKKRAEVICCERKRYSEYGGDEFLAYLKALNKPTVQPLSTNVTIDIPLLLTSTLLDLGIYKSYDVDEVFTDEANESVTPEIGEWDVDLGEKYCEYCGFSLNDVKHDHSNCHPTINITKGESKLKTLRKRKRSFDDFGIELPGIHIKDSLKLEMPYQVGYIKNIQTEGDKFYGDVIVSMTEVCSPSEVSSVVYEEVKRKAIIETNGKGFKEATTSTPLDSIKTSDVKKTVSYGNVKMSQTDVADYALSNYTMLYDDLVSKMSKLLEKNFPEYFCYKQDYDYVYNLTFGITDPESGDLVSSSITVTYKDSVYMIADDINVNVIYVLGGRLRKNGDKLELSETSPFTLNESAYSTWDGDGIWYQEQFPLKKTCLTEYTIDGAKKQYRYDVINFTNKETTYSFDGIDFPRKNYILCNDIRYRTASYHKFCTFNPVFRDEKMMGISSSMKEEYDVVIDRGSSAAFERHLQLSELKTWSDLENYRNGMFLNK